MTGAINPPSRRGSKPAVSLKDAIGLVRHLGHEFVLRSGRVTNGAYFRRKTLKLRWLCHALKAPLGATSLWNKHPKRIKLRGSDIVSSAKPIIYNVLHCHFLKQAPFGRVTGQLLNALLLTVGDVPVNPRLPVLTPISPRQPGQLIGGVRTNLLAASQAK